MSSTETPTSRYKQVTVDVPEDRIAEFHAFFGRFLAGVSGRGRRGRYGRHGHRSHGPGRRCARGAAATEPQETSTGASTEVAEV